MPASRSWWTRHSSGSRRRLLEHEGELVSWLRLDDVFDTNAKLSELSELERWRWVRVLLYCVRGETDGRISRNALREIGFRGARVDALVGLGLLEVNGSGYVVHDFLEYNPSREERELERERWRRWQADSRARRKARMSGGATQMSGADSEADYVGESSNLRASSVPFPRNPAKDGTASKDDSTARARARTSGPLEGGRAATHAELAAAADLLEHAGIVDGATAEVALELALRVPAALLEELAAGIPAHSIDPAGYVLTSLRAAVGAS